MLAIMEVGCVYGLLDPSLRIAHLAKLVQNCKAVIVLVDNHTKQQCGQWTGTDTVALNVGDVFDCHVSSAEIRATPDVTALILHTSGATGQPKGVMIKYSSLSNEVEAAAKMYELDHDMVVLQQSSFSFNMSVYQILIALSQGDKLYRAFRAMRGDPMPITEDIIEQNITHTCETPSEYAILLRHGDKKKPRKSR